MEQNTPASQLPDETLVGSLLMRTSRTFALNIPLLPESLRQDVGIAYLLFRAADTIEDGSLVDRRTKRRLFELFIEAVETSECDAFCAFADNHPPHDDHECQELLLELSRLLSMLGSGESSDCIRRLVIKSSKGMRRFTSAGGQRGNVRLKSLLELRQYCYFVAGIVGELLTELFLLADKRLAESRDELMELAPLFGEGLQLVNILKDAGADANEGRQFVHPTVPREYLFDLARGGLWYAGQYIKALETAGANRGVVQFAQLPVSLATATLECVEERGPGSKISREQLSEILASVLQSDEPVSTANKSQRTN